MHLPKQSVLLPVYFKGLQNANVHVFPLHHPVVSKLVQKMYRCRQQLGFGFYAAKKSVFVGFNDAANNVVVLWGAFQFATLATQPLWYALLSLMVNTVNEKSSVFRGLRACLMLVYWELDRLEEF